MLEEIKKDINLWLRFFSYFLLCVFLKVDYDFIYWRFVFWRKESVRFILFKRLYLYIFVRKRLKIIDINEN